LEVLAGQAFSVPMAVSPYHRKCKFPSRTSDVFLVSLLDWPCGCGTGLTH